MAADRESLARTISDAVSRAVSDAINSAFSQVSQDNTSLSLSAILSAELPSLMYSTFDTIITIKNITINQISPKPTNLSQSQYRLVVALGPVVQSCVMANPGLKFDPVF